MCMAWQQQPISFHGRVKDSFKKLRIVPASQGCHDGQATVISQTREWIGRRAIFSLIGDHHSPSFAPLHVAVRHETIPSPPGRPEKAPPLPSTLLWGGLRQKEGLAFSHPLLTCSRALAASPVVVVPVDSAAGKVSVAGVSLAEVSGWSFRYSTPLQPAILQVVRIVYHSLGQKSVVWATDSQLYQKKV